MRPPLHELFSHKIFYFTIHFILLSGGSKLSLPFRRSTSLFHARPRSAHLALGVFPMSRMKSRFLFMPSLALMALFVATFATAQSENIIHYFTRTTTDGGNPYTGLVATLPDIFTVQRLRVELSATALSINSRRPRQRRLLAGDCDSQLRRRLGRRHAERVSRSMLRGICTELLSMEAVRFPREEWFSNLRDPPPEVARGPKLCCSVSMGAISATDLLPGAMWFLTPPEISME